MKTAWMPLLIASSALIGCQSRGMGPIDLQDDALCSLRPISVNEAVRDHLRMPIATGEVPLGYDRFLRDIAAHNAKIRQHCVLERVERR
jgi:hypothetical protein